MAPGMSGDELDECMDILSSLGVLKDRVAWRTALAGRGDLSADSVDIGTRYLELIESSVRQECFSQLRFSPTSKQFYMWACMKGYDYRLAIKLNWVTHSALKYPLGNREEFLILSQDTDEGFCSANLSALLGSELRLGPTCVVDFWPSEETDLVVEPAVSFGVPKETQLIDVLPASYVAELKSVSESPIGAVTVADLVSVVARVVGAKVPGCIYTPASAVSEWQEYGAEAVVAVEALEQFEGQPGVLAGCKTSFMGVSDAMASYGAAVIAGKAGGMKISKSERFSAYILVDDPGATTAQTMDLLVRHKKQLKRRTDARRFCDCGGDLKAYECSLSRMMELFDGGFDGGMLTYEFTGDDVLIHSAKCSMVLSGFPDTSIKCDFQQACSAVGMAFERWMHERGLACLDGCGMLSSYHRYYRQVGNFECSGSFVSSVATFQEAILRALFKPVGIGLDACRYIYDSGVAREVVDGTCESEDFKRVTDLYGMDEVRGEIRKLFEWYQFMDRGKLTFVDILMAIDYGIGLDLHAWYDAMYEDSE